MATEGVGLREGGNYIAGTDFSKTGNLTSYGSNGTGQYLAVIQSTQTDRNVINCAANARALGIIQSDAALGLAAEVCFDGLSKAMLGGTVTRGDLLEVGANSQLITSTTAGHIGIAEAVESGSQSSIILVRVFPVPYLHP